MPAKQTVEAQRKYRFSEEHRARLRARMASFNGRRNFWNSAYEFEVFVAKSGKIFSLNPFSQYNMPGASPIRVHAPSCINPDAECYI